VADLQSAIVVAAGSATGVGTRRHAVGLDLAAPLLEVARHGFSSTFSNQMGQLGVWLSSGHEGDRDVVRDAVRPGPMLHLVDDLAGVLMAHDAPDAAQMVVGLAAPGWLGWADRHHIARLVDARGACRLVWASSPVVAAFATSSAVTAHADELESELVLAIDLDLGVSASIVHLDATGLREVAATSAAPSWATHAEAVAAVLVRLADAAVGRHIGAIGRVVVVAGTARSDLDVHGTIDAVAATWGDRPVHVVDTRSDIARALVGLADRVASDRVGATGAFQLVGLSPRSIGVLVDDHGVGRSRVQAVVAHGAPLPLRTTAAFDVGPDDGAEIFLDVYEAADPGGHRLIMTARLNDPPWPGRTRGDVVDIAFHVAADGLLDVQPAGPDGASWWSCSWAPSRWVTSAARAPQTAEPPDPFDAAPHTEPSPQRSPRRAMREVAVPVGLAEALGRAERVVSRQLGRLVAIRSAAALFGCNDHDDRDLLLQRAERLERVLGLSPRDDAGRAVHVAADVARRAVERSSGTLFAGGTANDVTAEVERVIEHLSVMIGAVTPIERGRLILDAQLLGFDHEHACALVDRAIDDVAADRGGPPGDVHDPTGLVVVSTSGFRLVTHSDCQLAAELDGDEAAIRVLLLEQ
jgi:hypothetical protein